MGRGDRQKYINFSQTDRGDRQKYINCSQMDRGDRHKYINITGQRDSLWDINTFCYQGSDLNKKIMGNGYIT